MAGPVKIAMCGALGRMGQKIIQVIGARQDMAVTGAVERPDCPQLGQSIGPLVGEASLSVMLTDDLKTAGQGADMYIDFTSPASSLKYLREAADMGLAAVIGTTGLSEAQREELATAAKKIPVLWAPNMSIGVNVMYKIAAAMVKMLGPDYDLEIVEAHHRLKKDAPSGTAVKLYETLAQARGLDPVTSMVTGRAGQVGERTDNEIGVMAIRGGDIVGDHTVYFCGPGERLELTHRVHTRDTLAQGAVRAAAWLAGRKPGLYSIDDTLSLDN
ncbi:MAG: 4-hydroxy-tetrahydrodipicolinate reductase [Candidatus Adiutrix sp.]|jgi:4-hydroxy-tetrahydrodipicolinate reductase|nr:4-hydroxy-tetrahydrodipicolinate reductase [Candidatus Adiutrix sp.]